MLDLGISRWTNSKFYLGEQKHAEQCSEWQSLFQHGYWIRSATSNGKYQTEAEEKQDTISVNKIDIQKLKDPSTREKFHAAVENKWGKVSHQPPEDVQVLWQKVKNTITETSKEELGHMPKRQQKEWLSQDTLNLLEERRHTTKGKENAATAKPYNYLCRAVKRSAKEDKEHLIRPVCKEVQDAIMQNKTKAVYEGVRKITCKQAPSIIKDKGGMVLTAPTAVKERWKEYFDELYCGSRLVSVCRR